MKKIYCISYILALAACSTSDNYISGDRDDTSYYYNDWAMTRDLWAALSDDPVCTTDCDADSEVKPGLSINVPIREYDGVEYEFTKYGAWGETYMTRKIWAGDSEGALSIERPSIPAGGAADIADSNKRDGIWTDKSLSFGTTYKGIAVATANSDNTKTAVGTMTLSFNTGKDFIIDYYFVDPLYNPSGAITNLGKAYFYNREDKVFIENQGIACGHGLCDYQGFGKKFP
ncbi:MAG: hypothetical protein LBH41_00450 [Rickettsiales bacterium]|nr:hypothetical protein [Rickettsiales bacterium]